MNNTIPKLFSATSCKNLSTTRNKHNKQKIFTNSFDVRGLASQATNIDRSESQLSIYELCSSSRVKKSECSDWKDCGSSHSSQINIPDDNLKPESTCSVELDCNLAESSNRNEILTQRKLKVAARKEIKKLEKKQMKEKAAPEQYLKPDFSLELAAGDFPSLDDLKTKRRFVVNLSKQESFTTGTEEVTNEKNTPIKDAKSSKFIEKSWKPKVKDPICINLSQALQNTKEKHQSVVKKADPSPHNILSGNMLDSDNPKRNKGKVRPDKKQKPSKLKMNILSERYERQRALLESKESSFSSSENLPSKMKENDCIEVLDNVCEDTKITLFARCEFQETQEIKTTSESKQDEYNRQNEIVISQIHSKKFREYCTNCLTEDIITSVCALLEKVAYFQDRLYVREPIKASAKRRYVAGINQTTKYLQVRKVKLLVIAPDLERNPSKGGLDEKVQFFKKEADCQNIPCVFGPNRKRLGRAVKKNTLVSCVAVLSYEGAEEQYSKVMEALHEAKVKYQKFSGYCENNFTENTQITNLKDESSYTSASDVTSSLLATLREDLAPADRLLNAINHCNAIATK